MTTTDLTALIISALLGDDAQTAADIATAIGCATTALRSVLRSLRADGLVVTSGRGPATRYVLALDEQTEQLAEVVEMAAVVPATEPVVAPVAPAPVEQRPFRGGRSLRDRLLNSAALLVLLAPVLYALVGMVRS